MNLITQFCRCLPSTVIWRLKGVVNRWDRQYRFGNGPEDFCGTAKAWRKPKTVLPQLLVCFTRFDIVCRTATVVNYERLSTTALSWHQVVLSGHQVVEVSESVFELVNEMISPDYGNFWFVITFFCCTGFKRGRVWTR